jgi:Ni/Co efflux regulator RcnB
MQRIFRLALFGAALSMAAAPMVFAQDADHPADRHAAPRPEDQHAPPRPEEQHAAPRPEEQHAAPRAEEQHVAPRLEDRAQAAPGEHRDAAEARPPERGAPERGAPGHVQVAGGGGRWHQGDRFTGGRVVFRDYRRYGLAVPPPGYEWVQDGQELLLISLATGLITNMFVIPVP